MYPLILGAVALGAFLFSSCGGGKNAEGKEKVDGGGELDAAKGEAGVPDVGPPDTGWRPEIYDFSSLPATLKTNLPNFLVAGDADYGATEVLFNGNPLPETAVSRFGDDFAYVVPLSKGDNAMELLIRSGQDVLSQVNKIVNYDPDFSTADASLLYVDIAPDQYGPVVSGTAVIDVTNNNLLGLIADKHVVGIAPAGNEIYLSSREVLDTARHQTIRTLAFSADIEANGFLVSPDGAYLYSGKERLDVAGNTLLTDLPESIATGVAIGGTIPGGPAISADGNQIIYGSPALYNNCNVKIVDTAAGTVTDTGIVVGEYLSDIALSPDGKRLFFSRYDFAMGEVEVYDAENYGVLTTISGLGDYAGEIAFTPDGKWGVAGSAGNAVETADFAKGHIMVFGLDDLAVKTSTLLSMADNLTVSPEGEIFVSAGVGENYSVKAGVDVYTVGNTGDLQLKKTFLLGINTRDLESQIQRIVYKP